MISQKLDRKTTICHYYIVMIDHKLKKKRTKDPICSFLKNLISPYGFGWAENQGVGRYTVLSATSFMLCREAEQPFRRGLNLLLSDPRT
jgi:hypothetical protein